MTLVISKSMAKKPCSYSPIEASYLKLNDLLGGIQIRVLISLIKSSEFSDVIEETCLQPTVGEFRQLSYQIQSFKFSESKSQNCKNDNVHFSFSD